MQVNKSRILWRHTVRREHPHRAITLMCDVDNTSGNLPRDRASCSPSQPASWLSVATVVVRQPGMRGCWVKAGSHAGRPVKTRCWYVGKFSSCRPGCYRGRLRVSDPTSLKKDAKHILEWIVGANQLRSSADQDYYA